MNKKTPNSIPKKSGPLPKGKKKIIDEQLREIYLKGGITETRAAINLGVSRQYVVEQFQKFALSLLVQDQKKYDDWIDKNAKVKLRALEGLSTEISNAETEAKRIHDQLDKDRLVHEKLLVDMLDNVKKEQIGALIKKIDRDLLLQIVTFVTNKLDMYKNFGHYIQSEEATLQTKIEYISQLRGDYDALEIMPPADIVVSSIIEERIAIKNKLFDQTNNPDPGEK